MYNKITIMNISIVLLIAFNSSFIYSTPLYKKDLRMMPETENFKTIVDGLRSQYNVIYNNIINAAKEGKHEYQFNIMCSHRTIVGMGCVVLPFQSNPFNFRRRKIITDSTVKMSLAISQKIFTQHFIKKLNTTFPDSTIVHLNKPCCDYKIVW